MQSCSSTVDKWYKKLSQSGVRRLESKWMFESEWFFNDASEFRSHSPTAAVFKFASSFLATKNFVEILQNSHDLKMEDILKMLLQKFALFDWAHRQMQLSSISLELLQNLSLNRWNFELKNLANERQQTNRLICESMKFLSGKRLHACSKRAKKNFELRSFSWLRP